jgi:hypothetical protein
MKKSKIVISLTTMLGLFLAACGTTSNSVVLPEKNGVYTVITFGSSEKVANQEAVTKATSICSECNKSMIVLKHASKYQGGLAKGDKELIKTGSEIASLIEGKDLSIDPSSSNDYKVVMKFQCQ